MKRDDVDQLVFALCHEIGNLLAASRLEAYLLRTNKDESDLAQASKTISRVAARSGSLLALIRPLLSPSTTLDDTLEVMEVLDRLHRGLDDDCMSRVRLDMKAASRLPDVSVNSDTIHNLLLTDVYLALAFLEPDETVSVSACVMDGGVAFQIEHRAEKTELEDSETLIGHALAVACASAILSASGGGVEVTRDEESIRVSYRVRTVESTD